MKKAWEYTGVLGMVPLRMMTTWRIQGSIRGETWRNLVLGRDRGVRAI